MKTIVLKNTSGSLFIEVKVDLMDTTEAFTVMSIEGRSDAEVRTMGELKELPSHIQSFADFATANNLLMDIVDIDPAVSTINVVGSVTALDITSSGALTGGNDTVPYSQPVVTEGGNGPYTFTLTSGTLPSGTELDANTGYIQGTPDNVANYTAIEITVTDAFGVVNVQAGLSINISA